LIKVGDGIRALFIASKDSLDASCHLTSESFLIMSVICLTNSAKLGINLLMKLILPRNDWMPFLDLGIDIF